VAILIDERDQVALADQEIEQDQDAIEGVTIERVNVTKQVYSCFLIIYALF
jgi:hypothetical protein